MLGREKKVKKENIIEKRYKGFFSGIIIFISAYLIYTEGSGLFKMNLVQAYATLVIILGLIIASIAIYISLKEKKGNKYNFKKKMKDSEEISFINYIQSEENKELFEQIFKTENGRFINNDKKLKEEYGSKFKKNQNKALFYEESYFYYVKEDCGLFLNEKRGVFFAKLKDNDAFYILGDNPFNYIHTLSKIKELNFEEKEELSLETYFEVIKENVDVDVQEKSPEELQLLIPELTGRAITYEDPNYKKILKKLKIVK